MTSEDALVRFLILQLWYTPNLEPPLHVACSCLCSFQDLNVGNGDLGPLSNWFLFRARPFHVRCINTIVFSIYINKCSHTISTVLQELPVLLQVLDNPAISLTSEQCNTLVDICRRYENIMNAAVSGTCSCGYAFHIACWLTISSKT